MQFSPLSSIDLKIFTDLIKVDDTSIKIPYSFISISKFTDQSLQERNDVCQSIIGKSCKVIEQFFICNEEDELQSKIMMICRDLEYGHYLVVSIQPSTNESECLASYLYFFSQTKEVSQLEKTWCRLTQKASNKDWDILDEIIGDSIESDLQVLLIGKEYNHPYSSIDPNVSELITNDFPIDCYSEDELPALVVVDPGFRSLCAILNHADGFARNVMVWDDFEDVLVKVESLAQGYEALCDDRLNLRSYIPIEDTIEEILYGGTYLLYELNEPELYDVGKIILEREDIILSDDEIALLCGLTSDEKAMIAKRNK